MACPPGPAVFTILPHEVGAHGYLVKGRVVRAFDAATRTLEVIQADEILIGKGGPRRFVIARDEAYFARKMVEYTTCDYELTKLDPTPRLYVLRSRPSAGQGEGGWIIGVHDLLVIRQPGLGIMLDEAARTGRLRRRPRADER